MTLKEFESHCDDLIELQIKAKPRFIKSQDIIHETMVWKNDSRIKLRKSFADYSKYIKDVEPNLIEDSIDRKIQDFLNRA